MQDALQIIGKIFAASAIRYFVLAGVPFLLVYILFKNRLQNYKIQSRKASRHDVWREIAHSMQTTAVLALIAYIVLFTPYNAYTLVYQDIHAYPWWWLPLSVLVSLVIHDTYFYWMHRLLHHPTIFKHTHLLHHRSTNPTPWASYSFHFLEAWTEGAVLLLIVLVIPVHPLGVMLFTVVAFIINVYGHLGYEIAPKRFRNSWLFKWVNTAVHHNLHHSKFKGNYGLYFRFWDRLMGTEYPDYEDVYDRVQQRRFN